MKTTFQYYILLLLTVCSLCSCDVKKTAAQQNDIVVVELTEREQKLMQEKMRLDSLNLTLEWKEIRDNLYINKNGELGFKTASFRPKIEFMDYYITNFWDDEEKVPLKDIVDPKSFKLIAGDNGWGGFYKDKNYIYHFFGNSDGGNFYIVEEADYATFEILEDCYGQDKNHVYHIRDGVLKNLDATTFKVVSNKHNCLAKDKNGYYDSGDQPLSEEELAAPEIQKLKKKLDKK